MRVEKNKILQNAFCVFFIIAGVSVAVSSYKAQIKNLRYKYGTHVNKLAKS